MAISIHGVSSGDERDAAEELKAILEPHLRPCDSAAIVVGAKCIGEPVEDIDILLFGHFPGGLWLGKARHVGHPLMLFNLALAIEVKHHPPNRVRFAAGNQVEVFYSSTGWSNASDKQLRQVGATANFLKRSGFRPPRIRGLMWLRGLSDDQLPSMPHNILAAKPSLAVFLRVLCQVQQPRRVGANGWAISFGEQTGDQIAELIRHFSRTLECSSHDRRRVEKVCERLVREQKYAEKLGSQLLVFRGRGGSGKTIHLLRLANDLYEAQDERPEGTRVDGRRVLLLTYNKALVADLRRLLSIIGVRNSLDRRALHVMTVQSLVMSVIKTCDEWEAPEGEVPFSEAYTKQVQRFVDDLGLFQPGELGRSFRSDNAEAFAWDYVLVDEGQDWLEAERDILFAAFGPTRCVVADGVDQFVRGVPHCDWTSSPMVGDSFQIVPLRQSLRQKANLGLFANAFAEQAGLNWEQAANHALPGGTVTIIDGPYTRELHEELLEQLLASGNQPIDALFCTESRGSDGLAQCLGGWGYRVWDGTDRAIRETYPTQVHEHRVVRYESCRGLEGWLVVCEGFSDFLGRQRSLAPKRSTSMFLEGGDERAARYASQWAMIPLTRAIDHLVLQIGPRGEYRRLLERLHAQHPDSVEWRETRASQARAPATRPTPPQREADKAAPVEEPTPDAPVVIDSSEPEPGAPRPYDLSADFDVGEAIEHKVFGRGKVIGKAAQTVTVMFERVGRKLLGCNR